MDEKTGTCSKTDCKKDGNQNRRGISSKGLCIASEDSTNTAKYCCSLFKEGPYCLYAKDKVCKLITC